MPSGGGEINLPSVSLVQEEGDVIYDKGIIIPNNEIWYKTSDRKAFTSVCEIVLGIINRTFTVDQLTLILIQMGAPEGMASYYSQYLLTTEQTIESIMVLLKDLYGLSDEELEIFKELTENFSENNYNPQENRGKIIFNSEYSIEHFIPYLFNPETITELRLPNSITHVFRTGLLDYNNIRKIALSMNLKSLDEAAFFGCSSIKHIVIPRSVEFIGSECFENCTSLKTITLPDNLQSLDYGTFGGCWSLKRISIPKKTQILNSSIFIECPDLKTLIYAEGRETIDAVGAKYIDTVIIPGSATEIGSFAFSGCSDLTNIIFEGTINEWTSVQKGIAWNNEVPALVVKCSDGEVQL